MKKSKYNFFYFLFSKTLWYTPLMIARKSKREESPDDEDEEDIMSKYRRVERETQGIIDEHKFYNVSDCPSITAFVEPFSREQFNARAYISNRADTYCWNVLFSYFDCFRDVLAFVDAFPILIKYVSVNQLFSQIVKNKLEKNIFETLLNTPNSYLTGSFLLECIYSSQYPNNTDAKENKLTAWKANDIDVFVKVDNKDTTFKFGSMSFEKSEHLQPYLLTNAEHGQTPTMITQPERFERLNIVFYLNNTGYETLNFYDCISKDFDFDFCKIVWAPCEKQQQQRLKIFSMPSILYSKTTIYASLERLTKIHTRSRFYDRGTKYRDRGFKIKIETDEIDWLDYSIKPRTEMGDFITDSRHLNHLKKDTRIIRVYGYDE